MANLDGSLTPTQAQREHQELELRIGDGFWNIADYSIKAQKGEPTDEDEEKIDSSKTDDSDEDDFSNVPEDSDLSEHTDSESTISNSSSTMTDNDTETYNTSSTPMDTDEVSISDETEEDSEVDSTGEESAIDSDVDDTEETTDDDSYNSADSDVPSSAASSETDRPSSESSDGTSTSTPASQDSDHTDTDINDENRPIEIPDEFTVRPTPKNNVNASGNDVSWPNDTTVFAVEPTQDLDKDQYGNVFVKGNTSTEVPTESFSVGTADNGTTSVLNLLKKP